MPSPHFFFVQLTATWHCSTFTFPWGDDIGTDHLKGYSLGKPPRTIKPLISQRWIIVTISSLCRPAPFPAPSYVELCHSGDADAHVEGFVFTNFYYIFAIFFQSW